MPRPTEEREQGAPSFSPLRPPGDHRPSPAGRRRRATSSEKLALLSGTGVLVLTMVHHVYGALLYETPERYHAVYIAGAALALMVSADWLSRRRPSSVLGRVAWWTGWSVNGVVAVLLFGAIEGFYNHVLKVALYFGGLPEHHMGRLYSDALFEMPNDVIFELTGGLHVIPSVFAAVFLAQTLVERGYHSCERTSTSGG